MVLILLCYKLLLKVLLSRIIITCHRLPHRKGVVRKGLLLLLKCIFDVTFFPLHEPCFLDRMWPLPSVTTHHLTSLQTTTRLSSIGFLFKHLQSSAVLVHTRCHGNQCSSPERGDDSVYADPSGGNPPMMTSLLHCSWYLHLLAGSQIGGREGSPKQTNKQTNNPKQLNSNSIYNVPNHNNNNCLKV